MTEHQLPLSDGERAYRGTRLAGDPAVAVIDLGGALTGQPIAREEEALLAIAVLSRYEPLRQVLLLAVGAACPNLRLGEVARAAYRQNFKVTAIASALSCLVADREALLACCQTVAWQPEGAAAVGTEFEQFATTTARGRIADVGLLLPAADPLAPAPPGADFVLGVSDGWPSALPLLVDPRWQGSLAERVDTALVVAGEGGVWVGADSPVLLGRLHEANLEALWERRPRAGRAGEQAGSPASGLTSLWRADPGVLAMCCWPLADGDPRGGVLERLTPESPDCAAGLSTHLSRYQFAAHPARGKRVLDVGCGVGYGSYYLATHGVAEVVGVDLSAEAIAYARRHYRHPNLTYLCADALSLPDALGPFDVVVAYEVFEHVDDGERFLDGLCEHLHDDGVLLVSTPNKLTFSPGHPRDSSPNPFHVREYYRDEFTALLDARFGECRLYGQMWERNFLARRHEASFGAETRAVLGRQLSDTREEVRRLARILTDQKLLERLSATEASIGTAREAIQRLQEQEAQQQALDARQDRQLLGLEEETLRLLDEMRTVVRLANGNFAVLAHVAARVQELTRDLLRSALLRLSLGGRRAEALHALGGLDLALLDLPALEGDPEMAVRRAAAEAEAERGHHA
jgi:SAM-dependent methyltransferase